MFLFIVKFQYKIYVYKQKRKLYFCIKHKLYPIPRIDILDFEEYKMLKNIDLELLKVSIFNNFKF